MKSPQKYNSIISIILPVYNREVTIIDSVKSVLNVTKNIASELIIVDDGSSDQTQNQLKKLALQHPNIKIHTIKHIGKPSAVRNYGVKKAKGKYIAFQDSDDVWADFDIEKRLRVFEDENIVLSYANAVYKDSGLGLKKYFVPKGTELGEDPFTKLISRFHSPIPTPTVIVRRSLFEKIGYFNENLKVSEDVEFWSRAALTGDFVYFDKVCAIIGRDGSNISSLASEKGLTALLDHEESQLTMLNSLLKQKNITKNQKQIIIYRIFELKQELDVVRKNLGEKPLHEDETPPDKPEELLILESEYGKSAAGKADTFVRKITFGNEAIYNKLKPLIRKIVRPFRRYI